ncbi:hypothetical protein DSM112329_02526 [Paraconexibacter sp. AEG42_29]|uniref:YchJ-like middle NTF2-like domain-containing protein n=2 Tax=Paraconexibacter sp. AEG42_29 TaxID=2997339 RepID=A0AAU7AVN9_9ACTN
MRSRFSAFAVCDPVYLLASWHPSTRPATLDLDLDLQWRRLEIVAVTAGAEDDRTGTVDFVAHYWDTSARERGRLDEHSEFVREDGQWYYVGSVD